MSNPHRLSVYLSNSDEPAAGDVDVASTTCFAVQAVAEPGLISRVLEQFAKRGLMPAKFVADGGGGGGLLDIDIQVLDLTLPDGEQIARGLRAIVGVCLVLTSEKHCHREARH